MTDNENLILIPGRLHSVAAEGHVSGADEIYDDVQQKNQETINSELIEAVGTGGSVDLRITNAVNAEKVRAQGEESTLQTNINAEATRAQTAESNLQELYGGLTQSNIEVVSTLPETGEAYKIYRLIGINSYADYMYNSSDLTTPIKMAEYDNAIDNVPTAGSDNLVKSGGVQEELALGAVYDVSAKNPTAGVNNDGKWESLSALLSDTNLSTLIPTSVRKGGMSIKFVQSSDNKYVQYRLMADEWSTNTEDWTIANEGVYVENPEFVRVVLDNENKILEAIRANGTKLLPSGVEVNDKIDFEGNETTIIENPEFIEVKLDKAGHILWGIQKDGNVYFGAGVPQQVIDYINERIAELSLDEYEDIVAFLNGLEEGDKTLQTLLNEKVDKEEGKSLIDAEYANGVSYIENPEFAEVKVDNEDRILEGIQKDGTKIIGGDLNVCGSAKILGNMEVSGVSYKVIENPEYLAAWLDAEDKVIFGFKADGKTYVGDADFLDDIESIKTFLANFNDKNIDWDALTSITATENPEYIEVKTDSEGKLLAGRTLDGAAFEKVGFSTPKMSIDGATIENIEDPEGRSEITIDDEDKILSYRDNNGVKHECGGLNTPSINGVSVDNLGISNSSNLSPREYNLPKYGYVDIQKELSFTDGTNSYLPTKISKVNDKYYVTASLVDGQVVPESIEVTLVESDIDTTQWPENTKTKHYCKVAIDFGSYLSGTFYVEVKFQGSSSIAYPKKNFRFTFHNNLLFSKKVKIKIGELIKTSKYNLKAYWIDRCVVREPVCYRIIQAINESQEYSEQYPWNSYHNIPTGATGLAMNFPIRIDVSGSFYGFEWFGLAKDISNFMLDDKTMNGILIQGAENGDPNFWKVLTPTEWDDILADEDNTIGEDSLQSVQNFFNYINSNSFNRESAAEHMNIEKWIDCIIIFEVFNSVDSLNKNFMLYAGPDKTIFYPMYYDFDYTFNGNSEQSVLINGIGMDKSIFYNFRKLFWEDICKRYKQLRKNILTTEFIVSTIQNALRSVEYKDYILEMSKWDEHGIGSVEEYSGWIDRRLKWLDSYYNL